MLEVFIVFVLFEYLLQPEVTYAWKRVFSLKGLLHLVLHTLLPAGAVYLLGLASEVQALLLFVLHAVFDGPLLLRLSARLPVPSISRTLTDPEHDDVPVQIQALQLSIAASNEKASWAAVHLLLIYAAMQAPIYTGFQ